MMEKSWDIIVWTEENTIDYVPSPWANKGRTQYKYPKNCTDTLKIRKLIDSCLEPEKFTWLDAICKAKCVKDLAMAKEMCDKGQYTSNLDISDNDAKQRRRKKRKMLYETSSESSSDDLPLSKFNSDTGFTKRHTAGTGHTAADKKVNSLRFIRETFTTPSSHKGSSVGGVRIIGHDDQNNNNTRSSDAEEHLNEVSNDNNLTPKHPRQDPEVKSSQLSSRLSYFGKGAQSGPSSGPSTSKSTEYSRVLKELHDIQFHVLENKKILNRLDAFMNTRDNFNANLVGNDLMYAEKLPCKTQGELEDINYNITNARNDFKELVNFLYLLGGSTPHKAIYSMMSKIFHGKLALEYSGQDRKKKLPFCSLKIYDAILAATRKRHPTESEDNIKKSVALFLATAKSRIREPENIMEPLDNEEDEDF